jgi:hypothetical protein
LLAPSSGRIALMMEATTTQMTAIFNHKTFTLENKNFNRADDGGSYNPEDSHPQSQNIYIRK